MCIQMMRMMDPKYDDDVVYSQIKSLNMVSHKMLEAGIVCAIMVVTSILTLIVNEIPLLLISILACGILLGLIGTVYSSYSINQGATTNAGSSVVNAVTASAGSMVFASLIDLDMNDTYVGHYVMMWYYWILQSFTYMITFKMTHIVGAHLMLTGGQIGLACIAFIESKKNNNNRSEIRRIIMSLVIISVSMITTLAPIRSSNAFHSLAKTVIRLIFATCIYFAYTYYHRIRKSYNKTTTTTGTYSQNNSQYASILINPQIIYLLYGRFEATCAFFVIHLLWIFVCTYKELNNIHRHTPRNINNQQQQLLHHESVQQPEPPRF
jgi:hypothetical protein